MHVLFFGFLMLIFNVYSSLKPVSNKPTNPVLKTVIWDTIRVVRFGTSGVCLSSPISIVTIPKLMSFVYEDFLVFDQDVIFFFFFCYGRT